MRNLRYENCTFVGELSWRFWCLALRIELGLRVLCTEVCHVVLCLEDWDEGRLHISLLELLEVHFLEPWVFLDFFWALAAEPKVLLFAKEGI